MAHQLSCDDEHSDGTINQYYRRYFPGALWEKSNWELLRLPESII